MPSKEYIFAREKALETMKRTFTKEDFLRNMECLCEGLTSEAMYNLYEACYIQQHSNLDSRWWQYASILEEEQIKARRRQRNPVKPSGFMRGLDFAMKHAERIFGGAK